MNREIKFRAWSEDFCVMYFSGEDSDYYEFGIDNQGVYCISYDVSISSPQTREKNRNIMQFTGLKDRGGVEIYEGDIVKSHIYYDNNLTVVKCEDMNCVYPLQYYMQPEDFEVVGNIYANPELLEKTDA